MKIKISTLILYFSVMVMLLRSSATMRALNYINLLLVLAQMIIFIYFGIKILFRTNKKSGILKIFLIFYLLLFISTIMGSKDFNSYGSYVIQAIGTILIVEYYMKKDSKLMIKSIIDCTSILLILNLITILILKNGFDFIKDNRYYFLGIRISFTPYVILLLSATLLYDKIQNNKKISKKSIILIVIAIINLIAKSVVTGIVTVATILFLIIIFQKKAKLNISLNKIMIIYSIIFIGIVVFSAQYKIPFFSYFLEDVLNKDLSFNNRDIIWSSAIEEIKKRPIMGYGITGSGGVEVEFEYETKVLVAHNQILHVLHEGGFVSLILFIIIFIIISKKLDKYKENYIADVIKSVLTGLLLMMITEVQSQKCIIFFILAISYNIEYLIQKNKSEKTIFKEEFNYVKKQNWINNNS